MDKLRAELVPQTLVAVTDNVSAVVPEVNEAVIAFVPCPEVTLPLVDEKVQLYEVIVLSWITLYGMPDTEHAPVVGPVITEGAAGTFLMTAVDALPLEPHALTAATVTFPDAGKLVPNETEMELLPCPDVMVAPAGTAQL